MLGRRLFATSLYANIFLPFIKGTRLFPFSESRDIEGLLKIFLIDNKKELKKYCKSLTIHFDDFINLIGLCETFNIGMKHRIYQKDIIPEDVDITKDDIEEIVKDSSTEATKRSKKFSRKAFQFFDVRRYLVAHVFYLPPGTKYWHFFYFDQRDLNETNNHWSFGAHIHFINYLWTEYTSKGIWEEFMSDKPKFKNALHIRCEGNIK